MIGRLTRTVDAATAGDADTLLASPDPVVVRGLAADWPLVAAGREGAERAIDYLAGFDRGQPIVGYTVPAAERGRYFYTRDLTALNFTREHVRLADYLGRMRATLGDASADALYVGSTDLDAYLPGFTAAHPCPLAGETLRRHPPLASIWLGNRTVAPAHWDMSANVAVCAVGRRRFTLFPPDQVANLYPGPLDPTPGGQVVSMVDFDAPDLARHPGFADALATAEIAELEPGDVLVYPALWWHQVEALGDFNAMVNYWWNEAAPFMDTPMTTLLHGLLSLRDRPMAEKKAWGALFDYYLFGPADRAGSHLPDHARGTLASPLDEVAARRLRAQIAKRLNR